MFIFSLFLYDLFDYKFDIWPTILRLVFFVKLFQSLTIFSMHVQNLLARWVLHFLNLISWMINYYLLRNIIAGMVAEM